MNEAVDPSHDPGFSNAETATKMGTCCWVRAAGRAVGGFPPVCECVDPAPTLSPTSRLRDAKRHTLIRRITA